MDTVVEGTGDGGRLGWDGEVEAFDSDNYGGMLVHRRDLQVDEH